MLRTCNLGIFWVEVDSRCVFDFISLGVLGSHAHAPLIKALRRLMFEGNWNIEISHVYREANTCANKLAKHGHTLQLGTVVFNNVSAFISLGFFADSLGSCKCWIVNL